MKMKQMIAVLCALIVAAVIFGTVMFFTRRDLKDAMQNTSNESSSDISEAIEKIDTEFILMQISVNAEKDYIKTGFLFDKYGKRHYFDITSDQDRSADEMYAEALKQKDFYEPEQFIPQSDIPLLYDSIKNINPDNKPLNYKNDAVAQTEYYYAILSDGIKTYPVLLFAVGNDGYDPSDRSSQSLKSYITNLNDSKTDENSFTPIPTDAFVSYIENDGGEDSGSASSKETSETGKESSETSKEASEESVASEVPEDAPGDNILVSE